MLRRIAPIFVFLIATLAGLSGVAHAVINDPTLYYTFDSISGTTVHDSGSGANDGTTAGSPSTAAGKVSNAISLNGSTQYTSVPNGGISGMGTGSFTIGCWVKLTSIGSYDGLWETQTDTSKVALYIQDSTHLYLQVNGNGGTRNITVSTGAWHHIVLVHDTTAPFPGGVVNGLYLDKTLVDEFGGSANVGTISGVMYIGKSPGNGAITGLVDDFRIFGRALSSTEVTDWYNYTGTGSAPLFRRGMNLRTGSRSPILYRFPKPKSPIKQLTAFLRRIAA